MNRYEYILFDADNTLFDFTKAEYLAFKETCRTGSIEFSDSLYRKYSEINDSLWKKLEKKEVTLDFLKLERFRMTLEEIGNVGNNIDEKAEFLRDTYMASLADQTCLIDGAEEVVHVLSQKYKLYIITNGISKIQRKRLSNSSIGEYFSDVFVSEELGVSKPERAYFDAVTEKIGEADLTKYLVVGDSLTSDCDGAIAYGIDICRFNPKNKSPEGRVLTYDISSLSELFGILLT